MGPAGSRQPVLGIAFVIGAASCFATPARMPVAEFNTIVMLTPVVATLVSRLWRKERISPLRWTLVPEGRGWVGIATDTIAQ